MPSLIRYLDRPYVLLTLTAAIWAGNAIAGRFADGHISPMWLTFLRWAIAVAVVGTLSHRTIRADWPVIRRHIPYLFAMGATGFTMFNYFLYSALTHTTAITVAIWQTTMPLFIFVIGFLAFRTRIYAVQVVGFAFTALGVVIIVAEGNIYGLGSGNYEANFGDLLMVGAAVAYASYAVGLGAKPKLHSASFLFCVMFAALIVATAGLVLETMQDKALAPSDLRGWSVAIYAGLFPSIVAQAFFIRGVEGIGPNVAGLFINLVPIITVLLAIPLLGERLFAYHALAFVLVVGGVIVASRKPATI